MKNYVCNGVIGATGPQGIQGNTGEKGVKGDTGIQGATGSQGIQGVEGTNGVDGKNTIVKTTTEPAGANCVNGGTKFEVGLDANNNGVLDSGEENSSLKKYVCNGSSQENILSGDRIPITRIGISGTRTWTCPQGVTQIKVELWGGGGGDGGGSYFTLDVSPPFSLGGSGGSGGYNSAIIQVLPGQVYNITIGGGGLSGVNIYNNNPYVFRTLCGTNGIDGGATNFNNILIASGGNGGGGGCLYVNPNVKTPGINGTNGTVINYSPYINNSETRSYLPTEYVISGPSCCSQASENGYCVISYN